MGVEPILKPWQGLVLPIYESRKTWSGTRDSDPFLQFGRLIRYQLRQSRSESVPRFDLGEDVTNQPVLVLKPEQQVLPGLEPRR